MFLGAGLFDTTISNHRMAKPVFVTIVAIFGVVGHNVDTCL